MVKWVKADEPVVDAVDAQMKEVLGKQLGATLVQSVHSRMDGRCGHGEGVTTTFDDAIRQLVPVLYPDLLFRLDRQWRALFPDFAAKIKPTNLRPGVIRGRAPCPRADWMTRWSDGLEPCRQHCDASAAFLGYAESNTFYFHIDQYLYRRAKDWKERGLHRDGDRLGHSERALEVLQRSPAGGFQELEE